jgi:hypothetical protein
MSSMLIEKNTELEISIKKSFFLMFLEKYRGKI